VEDEAGVRDLVRDVLEMHGYAVLEASNGPGALAVSERHPGPIALVLTDVIMPGMSGYELAQRLARQRPEIRVLYMSGYTDPIVHHGMRGRGVAFLGKPFSPDAVARKVREALRAPAAGSAPDS
jgi:CheY-like chemotaxis protein